MDWDAYFGNTPSPTSSTPKTDWDAYFDTGGVTEITKGGVPKQIEAGSSPVMPGELTNPSAPDPNPSDPIDRARFVPLGRNKATGEAEFPVWPQAALGLGDMMKGGWDLATGQTPLQMADPQTGEVHTNPQAIKQGMDVAMLTSPMTPGSIGARGVAAAETVAPKAASAGLQDLAVKGIKSAKESGVYMTPEAFKPMAQEFATSFVDMGLDPKVLQHGPAKSAVDWMEGLATKDGVSFRDIHILRSRINNAAASQDGGTRKFAMVMKKGLDGFMKKAADEAEANPNSGLFTATGSMTPKEATTAFQNGIKDYAVSMKAERIADLLNRAELKSTQFSQSGMENAIRTVFRQVAGNKNQMRTYTQEEQKLINLIASGGNMQAVGRWLGKVAPKGVVSAAGGAALADFLGVPKEVLWGVGFVGGKVADRMAVKRVNALREHVMSGASEESLQSLLTPEVYAHLMADPRTSGVVKTWLDGGGNPGVTRALAASIVQTLNVPDQYERVRDELSKLSKG